MVDLLNSIATRLKATPAQVALAGCSLRSHGSFRSLAPSELQRLIENLGADSVELTRAVAAENQRGQR